MNEMYRPSGETRPWAFSGLPNSALRGMTGVPATASAGVGLGWPKTSEDASSAATEKAAVIFMSVPGPFGGLSLWAGLYRRGRARRSCTAAALSGAVSEGVEILVGQAHQHGLAGITVQA